MVTLTFSNNETIELFNTKNYIFFAFDWINIKRNFNDYRSGAIANNPVHNNKYQYVHEPIREAFNMRLGFEVDVYKGNTLLYEYILLDTQNPMILGSSYAETSSAPTLAYEVGGGGDFGCK